MGNRRDGGPERLQGERARLIPIGGSGQAEANATSAFLATLPAVDEFAQAITNLIGVRLGKRARVRCYTEVKLKAPKELAGLRPDGLIQITTGRKTRNFLVEAKVKKDALRQEQVEGYLKLARALELDGVITISNQVSSTGGSHPVEVSGHLLRSVKLHHWSWSSIITEAVIVAKHKGVSDPDQAYILGELIRYLEHDKSGVIGFDSMGPTWKDVARKAYIGEALSASSEEIRESVAAWHQALRYVSLMMSRKLGSQVSIKVTRMQVKEPETRIRDDCTALCETKRIEAKLQIPDAADNLLVRCDFLRRAIVVGMSLKAPDGFKQARAHETWIKKQLKECDDPEVRVQANWPGRAPSTSVKVDLLGTDESELTPRDAKGLPQSFDVSRMVELGTRVGQSRTFVDDLTLAVSEFYRSVGQHLVAWQPPAPQVKDEAVPDELDGDPERPDEDAIIELAPPAEGTAEVTNGE